MARFLVTGGAGFIGSNVVTSLLQGGHDVRVLDNFLTGKRENLADVLDQITLIEGDLRDPVCVNQATEQIEYILHIGALPSVPRSVAEPLLSHDINVNGTLYLLEAARQHGVKRLVFSSSSSVYGDTPTLPKHEAMPMAPLSPYAAQKAAGELYCRVYSTIYGLETVCLRYFNVFGPRQDPQSQYAAVIPKFITAFQTGNQPTIYGNGEQSRDFTYVENVVVANIAATTAPEAAGKTFNVACGSRLTVNEIARKISTLLGTENTPVYAPARPGDVKHSLADISQAQHLLQYSPLIDIDTGLQKTIAWFSNR
ncbi:NAD-dependent epimerase/dehydratase family protein [candidate division KSB3 bacterium]|uniref:NAD-dependent epimerase/dehydratase family protein n=1 Tax=candidate division KSB3 bacterium TaxID=2044937 RepID=A0A9D5Q5E7_9BACT|nr:NAD-dependent epimerase/dehydratase family protein [candidate division KSB3 bacterium]MBD3324540.1 NAD-dependent epimerase/dehydratase family protein [candidate division KSB3 bacterium]